MVTVGSSTCAETWIQLKKSHLYSYLKLWKSQTTISFLYGQMWQTFPNMTGRALCFYPITTYIYVYLYTSFHYISFCKDNIKVIINFCTNCSNNKVESVLPFLTVFLWRHEFPFFIMLPFIIITTAFLLWHTLHGNFFQIRSFRRAPWIAALKS